MDILKLFFLSVGVSVDAFTVALCKGLSGSHSPAKTAAICSVWFGIFQIVFPLLGFLLGSTFETYIDSFDHYIIFVILVLLGCNSIKEAFSKKSTEPKNNLGFKSMFLISFATSLDSLAVGITLALARANLTISLLFISGITIVLTVIGVFIGNKFGKKYKKQATLAGGIILIMLAIEILVEHLCF